MKNFKGKKKKVKEVKFDAINGKVGDTNWAIDYSKAAKRYALRSDAGFFYSHASLTACQKKAANKEVVWE